MGLEISTSPIVRSNACWGQCGKETDIQKIEKSKRVRMSVQTNVRTNVEMYECTNLQFYEYTKVGDVDGTLMLECKGLSARGLVPGTGPTGTGPERIGPTGTGPKHPPSPHVDEFEDHSHCPMAQGNQ